MKLLSVLIAIAVSAVLYLFVVERDRLTGLFGADADDAAQTAPATPNSDGAQPVQGAVPVMARHSTASSLPEAVLVRGRTEAARQAELRAETASTVVSAPLRKGRFVKAGEALCTLDPGTRPVALAQAEAQLAEAKARLPEAQARVAQAEAQLEEALINDRVAQQLKNDGFASQTRVASTRALVSTAEAAIQSARAGLDGAQSGISTARASVAAAQKEIDRLTITAPFGGVLESDTAELGTLLQAGALCATVIQLDPIKLVGFLPEIDVDKIARGSAVSARLISGREVSGEVTFLSRAADETTRTFRVEAEIDNPDLIIRDGQTAEIRISSGETAAHLIPQSALTLADDGRLGVRIIDADSKARFRPAQILLDTVDGAWVTGLGDAADIILLGQEFVTDGVPVTPSYQELLQ